jgi:hypothetical protein
MESVRPRQCFQWSHVRAHASASLAVHVEMAWCLQFLLGGVCLSVSALTVRGGEPVSVDGTRNSSHSRTPPSTVMTAHNPHQPLRSGLENVENFRRVPKGEKPADNARDSKLLRDLVELQNQALAAVKTHLFGAGR